MTLFVLLVVKMITLSPCAAGNSYSDTLGDVVTHFLDAKVCIAIAVILITLLLLTPTSTNAFRQHLSFTASSEPLTNLKAIAMKKDDPVTPVPRRPTSLMMARSESIQSIRKKIDDLAVMFEERKESVKKFLDEFSQPFMDTSFYGVNNTSPVAHADTVVVEEEEEHTVVIENDLARGDATTHFCFLVHGYNGRPADLLYLRTAMADAAEKEFLDIQGRDAAPSNNTAILNSKKIVFHSCQSNWGRTSDGVEKGGQRILEEIRSVIREQIGTDQQLQDKPVNITVSLIGNSLGGLYSRYAIAKLAEGSNVPDEEFLLLDGKVRAHFNIFCTTATPHLGVSGHTYIPIPRSAEIGIGKIMGQTGRDIFRLSDLIKTMCTCPSYLKPLGSFRKRIAYANAYKTDFVVPTNTAAFLNPESTYPHHISDDDGNGVQNVTTPKNGMIVATFHTPPGNPTNTRYVNRNSDSLGCTQEPESPSVRERCKDMDELLNMSTCMDELGWKKVIVDVREHMPVSIRIPSIVKRKSSGMQSSSSDSDSNGTDSNSVEKIPKYGIVESRDIANAFSTPTDILAFPLGHNTLVAVEKHGLSKTVFQGGRPLMDELAKEIVQEILAWDPNSDDK